MALKKKLTKAEFDKLSDSIKSEYIEDGDGYRLDIDGDEDTGALKRAKDREKELRQQAEAKLREAQEQLDALGTDDARKKGDIATLEKAWQKKLDDQKNEYEGKVSKLTKHTTQNLVDNVASSIAHKITAFPALLLPHIKGRLIADFEGETPTTKVLDKDGKVSILTVEQLEEEFVANKDFSAIILASKASGGAGAKPSNLGGGATSGTSDKPADLSKASPTDLVAHLAATKSAT